MWTLGSQELVILACPLNNEKICREISEYKIAACEKTCGSTEWELFGFELIVLGSASSRNIFQNPRYA